MVIHLIFKYSGAFLQLYKVVPLNKYKSNVTKNNLKNMDNRLVYLHIDKGIYHGCNVNRWKQKFSWKIDWWIPKMKYISM